MILKLLNDVKQKPLITNNYIRDLRNFKENFMADLHKNNWLIPPKINLQLILSLKTWTILLQWENKEQKLNEKP